MLPRRFPIMASASWLLAGLACAAAACDRSQTPPPVGTPTASPPDRSSVATSTSAPLPPGVIAQAIGRTGIVRVEQRGTSRVLTIDGIVQGGTAAHPGVEPGRDPLVDLARMVRPGARSALLIGLGTGATATALARAGMQVEAVELEPVIVDFARRYFDYRGNATVGDGLEFARTCNRSFDLVIVDAFDGKEAPSPLATPDAASVFRGRRTPDGVLLIRTLGAPDSARVTAQWSALRDRFRLGFSSGIDQERQNIVMIASAAPLTIDDATAIPMWPLGLSEGVSPALREAQPGSGGAERELVVTGYLVRDASGAVFVELPHLEMGGVRYLLDEAGAKEASPLLPAAAKFPTQGDIRTDGDPAGTLRDVLGGGGVKRSDVRFSPVVARIRGKARLRAVIDPDANMGMGRSAAPPASNPLLPYGGVLYELRDARVLWSLRHSDWQAAHTRRLQPIVGRAASALTRGRIDEGVAELKRYLQEAGSALGEPALRLPAIDDVGVLKTRLEATARPASNPPGAAWTARACDTAVHGLPLFDDGTSMDALKLRESLVACASSFYERSALREEGDDSAASARRLLALLPDDDTASSRRVRKAVRERHGELTPLQEPPGTAAAR